MSIKTNLGLRRGIFVLPFRFRAVAAVFALALALGIVRRPGLLPRGLW